MRPRIQHPFGLMVSRFPAILAVLVALSGVDQAQAAPQPEPKPQPKTPPPAADSPEKPAAAEAAQPAKTAGLGARTYVPIDVVEELKTKRTEVKVRMRQAGQIADNQRETFERYYREYELAGWTAPDQLNDLPDRRKDLINTLKLARGTQFHDDLVALSLDFLGTLAGEAIRHPAARYNAMLAIGELNQREADGGQAPQPLPEALPLLLEAFTDANQIDAVRIAALLGLYRHAAINIEDAQFRDNQLIPAMLAFVQSKTAPGRAPEGHAWMRARAIDVLGALGQVGAENAVPDALVAVVADGQEDLLIRCAAARALGRLEYPANHGLDAWKLCSALGQLASDACLAEFERMDEEAEQEERKQRRPRGGMMPGMYDMGMDGGAMPSMEPEMYGGSGMPGQFGLAKDEEEEDETLGNRRRLMTSLNAALVGLTGMKWSAWTVWVRRNNTDQPAQGVASLGAGGPKADLIAGETGILKQFEGLFEACEKPRDEEEPRDRETLRMKIEAALSPLTQALNAGRPADAEEPAKPAPPAETEVPAGAKPATKPAESAPGPAAKPAGQPAGNP